MGEYAIRATDGEEIKIGTCEDMYYLRAEQRHQVRPLSGNVNPGSTDALALRFRFPWPDEDGTQPGEFHDKGYERGVFVPGAVVPANTEHYPVQFSAQAGYLISLPCPEGTPDARVHRNGFAGAVQLEQQKLLTDGRLVPVCRCGGCGAKWRMEDQADIEALALAFRIEGDKRQARGDGDPMWWHLVADRILLGALILEPIA
jgi:hypothetical protein